MGIYQWTKQIKFPHTCGFIWRHQLEKNSLGYGFAKKCEECETLPYLQGNKLACYSSTEADRRHEAPRSETKDFITRGNNSIHSVKYLHQFPVHTGQRDKGQMIPIHAVGCILREETWAYGSWIFCKGQ